MNRIRPTRLLVPTLLLLIVACSKAPDVHLIGSAKKGEVYSGPTDKSADATQKVPTQGTTDTITTGGDTSLPSSPVPTNPIPPSTGPVVGTIPTPTTPAPLDPNAPVTPCATLDFAKITKIEDIRCLGSREKVIQSLPDPLRSYFTLIQTTRSAQNASLDKPRVVLVSPDGSLLLGAASETDGRQDMEVALYDYEKNAYDFAGIDFSTNPPKIERDLCKTCHGQDPHPIWAAYSRWDGTFEPTNRGLTAEQATVLNKLAKGDTDSPVLKALKYKSSYAADKLFNANSGMSETETNEMIGVMMAVKRSQMLTAKLMADSKVTKADLGKVIHEALCEDSQDALESLGYKVNEHLMTGIVGKDERGGRFVNPNIGFEPLSFFFGNILLKAAMDKDPTLKSKLSSIEKFFYNNNSYDLLTGKGLASFLDKTKAKRSSWLSFRGLVHNNLNGAFGKGSDTCNVIKSYQ